MNKPKLKHRKNKYFNKDDTYLFNDTSFKFFESKVHFKRGCWWTNESLNFKATSLPCTNLKKRRP